MVSAELEPSHRLDRLRLHLLAWCGLVTVLAFEVLALSVRIDTAELSETGRMWGGIAELASIVRLALPSSFHHSTIGQKLHQKFCRAALTVDGGLADQHMRHKATEPPARRAGRAIAALCVRVVIESWSEPSHPT
jgi:hypothetical protein